MEGHVAKRRYFYITFLREPVARYLSEFRHVQRGATWKGARHFCKDRSATKEEVTPCFTRENWQGVELDEFTGCESNLAANRQTRMLADLELVGCYDLKYMPKQERDRVMLASAKRNLQSMAFFGLTEYQKMSQYVFEETFNLRFGIPFEQNNATVSSHIIPTLNAEQVTTVAALNALDTELYNFAKRILFDRFDKLKARDSDFVMRFEHLGELSNRGTDFDWEKLVEESSDDTA